MLNRLAAFAILTTTVTAQSNAIPGTDGRLTNIGTPQHYGRRGPAHPNGEVAMCYAYTMCNNGSIVMPWLSTGSTTSPMNAQHPMFAFMVVRQSGGRMLQISDDRAYVKHAFAAANSSSICGPCQNPGTGSAVGIGCADTYGSGTNANRYWLGPRREIDPWTGLWDPVGSYFDQGDPNVGAPNNTDGIRSLTNGSFGDLVKNRVALHESDLLAAGTFYYYMHVVVEAEPGNVHGNNMGYRRTTPSWNGTDWDWTAATSFVNGSVLDAWQGATVHQGGNGADDGVFFVGVQVTGPSAGLYHYEYAVHNFDNSRGAATLRIPLCGNVSVSNVGFRDIDGAPINDWSATVNGSELTFSAPMGNPLQWNQIFNFWFDCDAPPASGNVALDQALPGPGALSVSVSSQVPSQPTASVSTLGAGCGSPAPFLAANGVPAIPNPAFAMVVLTSPGAAVLLLNSVGSASTPLGANCVQYLDGPTMSLYSFSSTNGGGSAVVPVPVPNAPGLSGLPIAWQAAQLVPGGPVLGELTLSNGVLTTLGCN